MSEAEPKLRELKARAQLLKPSLRLGKAGASPEFIAALNDILQQKELVKVKFDDFKEKRTPLSRELAERTASILVQQVGHTVVLFRRRTSSSS